MPHFYVILGVPYLEEAIIKGRTDYDQPPWNRSVQYNLDGSKVLLEGMFSDEEYGWFLGRALFIGTAEDAQRYIAGNRAEWEAEGEV